MVAAVKERRRTTSQNYWRAHAQFIAFDCVGIGDRTVLVKPAHIAWIESTGEEYETRVHFADGHDVLVAGSVAEVLGTIGEVE